MCRIGGRLRDRSVSFGGANGEIPLLFGFGSNPPQGGDNVWWVV
jgi:hypothetical protein